MCTLSNLYLTSSLDLKDSNFLPTKYQITRISESTDLNETLTLDEIDKQLLADGITKAKQKAGISTEEVKLPPRLAKAKSVYFNIENIGKKSEFIFLFSLTYLNSLFK